MVKIFIYCEPLLHGLMIIPRNFRQLIQVLLLTPNLGFKSRALSYFRRCYILSLINEINRYMEVSIHGGTPKIIRFSWDFPWNRPYSYWGTPMETPMYEIFQMDPPTTHGPPSSGCGGASPARQGFSLEHQTRSRYPPIIKGGNENSTIDCRWSASPNEIRKMTCNYPNNLPKPVVLPIEKDQLWIKIQAFPWPDGSMFNTPVLGQFAHQPVVGRGVVPPEAELALIVLPEDWMKNYQTARFLVIR